MIFNTVLAAGIAATVMFLVLRIKKGGVPALLAKSVPGFLFISLACTGLLTNPGVPVYGLLIIAGLVCGLLGDIWLDLKYVYPEDSSIYLYAGFGSFFAGHVLFITAIFTHFDWSAGILVPALLISAAGAGLTIVLEKPLGLNYGKFRSTALVYGFILFLTAVSSITAALITKNVVWVIMSAGGILFLLSDLVLSGTYFGKGKTGAAWIIANHGLYYAAQFCIASSVLFAK